MDFLLLQLSTVCLYAHLNAGYSFSIFPIFVSSLTLLFLTVLALLKHEILCCNGQSVAFGSWLMHVALTLLVTSASSLITCMQMSCGMHAPLCCGAFTFCFGITRDFARLLNSSDARLREGLFPS